MKYLQKRLCEAEQNEILSKETSQETFRFPNTWNRNMEYMEYMEYMEPTKHRLKET